MKQGKKKYMLEMMEKLLPCRKCGKRPIGHEYGRGQFHLIEIECSNKKCDNVTIWHRKSIDKAIKAWNKGEPESNIKVIDLKEEKEKENGKRKKI